MWKDAMGQSIRDFNFRTVTAQFSKLAFNYPIRVPERFALVIRTLLTQEGICMTLDNDFKLLEVAYPYVAKRLLRDPQYSSRLPQVKKPTAITFNPNTTAASPNVISCNPSK